MQDYNFMKYIVRRFRHSVNGNLLLCKTMGQIKICFLTFSEKIFAGYKLSLYSVLLKNKKPKLFLEVLLLDENVLLFNLQKLNKIVIKIY